MYRLVRIEGLHVLRHKSYALSYNCTLKFVLYNGEHYKTVDGLFKGTFVEIQGNDNLFDLLNINGQIYIESLVGYKCSGNWPMVKPEDFQKVLLSLFDLNPHINIPPLYKVGDEVVIKSEYDEHSTSTDYTPIFPSAMLNRGVQTIVEVLEYDGDKTRKHYIEPFSYKLKGSSNVWTAAMFDTKTKVNNQTLPKITSITSHSDYCTVHYTDNTSSNLKLCGAAFLDGHNLAFRKCGFQGHLNQLLRSELTCSFNGNGYEPMLKHKRDIWIFIDDLKYRFGTEECKRTINPKYYTYRKDFKTEVKQIKPQEHAYQFCKMRGTMRVGSVPKGNRICGKRSKASISSRPISYRKVTGY